MLTAGSREGGVLLKERNANIGRDKDGRERDSHMATQLGLYRDITSTSNRHLQNEYWRWSVV